MPDDLHTRIAAVLKTANDRVAGFIGYDEMADAVICELQRPKRPPQVYYPARIHIYDHVDTGKPESNCAYCYPDWKTDDE